MKNIKKILAVITEFFRDLIYGPDGRPSLMNVIACGLFSLFAFVTLYLVLTGRDWSGYTAFTATTTTFSTLGKTADKYMNNHFGG